MDDHLCSTTADRLPGEMLCWIEVDLDAIADNVRALQAAAQPRQGVTAVVKAQAYGMGGAAVSRVSEARRLRQAGFCESILLLGGLVHDEYAEVVSARLTPSLTDWASAEGVAAAAHAAGETCKVQVKVDTGMTRYGAPPDEAMAIVRGLRSLPTLELEGFYTHFAAADDPDPFFAHQQLARFLAICQQLESEGVCLGIKHAANSARAVLVPA